MPNRKDQLLRANVRTPNQDHDEAHSRTPSSLSQLVPKNWNAEELENLREAAWKNQGVAMLSLQDVEDEFERQFLSNMATKRFGKRAKK